MAKARTGHVGRWERLVRIALGITLLGFALVCPWAASLGPVVTWPSAIVGAVLLATGAIGWCPVYRMAGHPRRDG